MGIAFGVVAIALACISVWSVLGDLPAEQRGSKASAVLCVFFLAASVAVLIWTK